MTIVSKMNNHIEKNVVREIEIMRNLEKQQPAEGILKNNDWGSSKTYKVTCSCGDDNHSHNIWIESDDHGVSVTISTQLKSKWWSITRWKQIWNLLTKGFVEVEECVILSEQQAYNYANALLWAVNDVQEFINANR